MHTPNKSTIICFIWDLSFSRVSFVLLINEFDVYSLISLRTMNDESITSSTPQNLLSAADSDDIADLDNSLQDQSLTRLSTELVKANVENGIWALKNSAKHGVKILVVDGKSTKFRICMTCYKPYSSSSRKSIE